MMQNKTMTWETIVKTYPDQRVFLKDCVYADNDIKAGVVVDAAKTDKLLDAFLKWQNDDTVERYSTVPETAAEAYLNESENI